MPHLTILLRETPAPASTDTSDRLPRSAGTHAVRQVAAVEKHTFVSGTSPLLANHSAHGGTQFLIPNTRLSCLFLFFEIRDAKEYLISHTAAQTPSPRAYLLRHLISALIVPVPWAVWSRFSPDTAAKLPRSPTIQGSCRQLKLRGRGPQRLQGGNFRLRLPSYFAILHAHPK